MSQETYTRERNGPSEVCVTYLLLIHPPCALPRHHPPQFESFDELVAELLRGDGGRVLLGLLIPPVVLRKRGALQSNCCKMNINAKIGVDVAENGQTLD